MANETKLSHLINPEVMADMIEQKLTNALKFTPLCRIDNTLVGRPGDTVTLPRFKYIGSAQNVAELGAIPVSELEATRTDVKVKKAGRGVVISDEAVLSAFGDPVGEIAKQLALAIADRVNADTLASLDQADLYFPVVNITADDVNNALVLMGEDFEGEKYLFIGPETYAYLRNSTNWIPLSELGADIQIKGVVGMVYGCYVVITNLIRTRDKAYIVKPGALALYQKRDTQVETSRDIIHKSTTFTADKHYVTYMYDSSKAIRMSTATMDTITVEQLTNIADSKATLSVKGYPTNLPYGWTAYFAEKEQADIAITAIAEFAPDTTHSAFKDNVFEGADVFGATNNTYFHVIYVDGAGYIRAAGAVKTTTSIA